MDKVTTIAVDIAKRIFSLYWVNPETGEIGAKMLTRAKFEEFMRTREPVCALCRMDYVPSFCAQASVISPRHKVVV